MKRRHAQLTLNDGRIWRQDRCCQAVFTLSPKQIQYRGPTPVANEKHKKINETRVPSERAYGQGIGVMAAFNFVAAAVSYFVVAALTNDPTAAVAAAIVLTAINDLRGWPHVTERIAAPVDASQLCCKELRAEIRPALFHSDRRFRNRRHLT